MKTSTCLLVLIFALHNGRLDATPVGTAFTYQGRLTDNNGPVNGLYDVNLRLFTDANGSTQVGGMVPKMAVAVSNGLFTTLVDFGPGIFTGQARWIEIAIRTNGSGAFATLAPRQELTPAPYALYAPMAGSVSNGSVVATQLNTTNTPAAGQILAYDGTSLVWQQPGGGVTSVWSLNGSSAYYNDGNVGIGTPNPQRRLQVGDDQIPNSEGLIRLASRSGSGPASRIWEVGVPEIDEDTAFGYHFVIDDTQRNGFNPEFIIRWDNGNVGIGTNNPQAKLEVASSGLAVLGVSEENDGVSGRSNASDKSGVFGYSELGNGVTGTSGGEGIGVFGYSGLNFFFEGGAGVYGLSEGNDGVSGRSNADGKSGVFGYTERALGYGGFFMNAGGGQALHAEGDAWISRSLSTCSLAIRGGCDLAEPFEMSGAEVPKGAVVVIDETEPGRLKLSTRAYDTRVAGIVSGANGINTGIALVQEGILESGQNVALTGRVYVKADATNGAIQPGDLLTTSDTPGHAMRAADHTRAHGAILGKAMTPLKEGKGLVLVLVTLH